MTKLGNFCLPGTLLFSFFFSVAENTRCVNGTIIVNYHYCRITVVCTHTHNALRNNNVCNIFSVQQQKRKKKNRRVTGLNRIVGLRRFRVKFRRQTRGYATMFFILFTNTCFRRFTVHNTCTYNDTGNNGPPYNDPDFFLFSCLSLFSH